MWMEEDAENRLSLLGLASSSGISRVLDIPDKVDLKHCRFMDWDDAEGILCTLAQDSVWILDFAS